MNALRVSASTRQDFVLRHPQGQQDFVLVEGGRTLGLIFGTGKGARKLAALLTAAPEMEIILRGLIEEYEGKWMRTPEEDARWDTVSRLLERLDRGDLA